MAVQFTFPLQYFIREPWESISMSISLRQARQNNLIPHSSLETVLEKKFHEVFIWSNSLFMFAIFTIPLWHNYTHPDYFIMRLLTTVPIKGSKQFVYLQTDFESVTVVQCYKSCCNIPTHKAHALQKIAYTLYKLQLIDSVIIKLKCKPCRALDWSVSLFLRERFQNTIAVIKYIVRTYIDILFW